MRIYNVNNGILSNLNTPPNKRGVVHLSWLKALLSPLQTLNDNFANVYFPDVFARSKRNAQKIVLEHTLNSIFNANSFPLIYINNTGTLIDIISFYTKDETNPVPIYAKSEGNPLFIYTKEEYFNGGMFVVNVPSAVIPNFNENQIKSEVDKYRPAGTKYEINIY
jgi:hypothetical protein